MNNNNIVETELCIEDTIIPVKIRRNSRALRAILRVDPRTRGAIVTLPKYGSNNDAFELVRRSSDWILKRITRIPEPIKLGNGVNISLLGQNYIICHDLTSKVPAKKMGHEIIIGGRKEHLGRRTRDWLKKQAKVEILPRAMSMAKIIDRKIGRLTIRDTKSRWGSCTSEGNISFCWRLVMSPDWVLDYVVAHEVSHLLYMNHSTSFWQTVDRFNVKVKEAKKWLSDNGAELHRYE